MRSFRLTSVLCLVMVPGAQTCSGLVRVARCPQWPWKILRRQSSIFVSNAGANRQGFDKLDQDIADALFERRHPSPTAPPTEREVGCAGGCRRAFGRAGLAGLQEPGYGAFGDG